MAGQRTLEVDLWTLVNGFDHLLSKPSSGECGNYPQFPGTVVPELRCGSMTIVASNPTICLTLCDYVVWFLCHVVLPAGRFSFRLPPGPPKPAPSGVREREWSDDFRRGH